MGGKEGLYGGELGVFGYVFNELLVMRWKKV